MDALAARLTNRLAYLVTAVLGAAIVISVVWSVALPGSADLTAASAPRGVRTVRWLAPDGPAWSFGIRPGDRLLPAGSQAGVDRGAVIARSSANGQLLILPARATAPSPLDLVVAMLGLGFLIFGLAVLVRSAARTAAAAFWLVGLALGAAMGFVPAGYHGVVWALPLDFIGLRCLGPAVLALALAFPRSARAMHWRRLLWLPAVGLIALYAVTWWRPAPLFDRMHLADNLELAVYLVAASLCMVSGSVRSESAQERAQRRMLAIGVVGGVLPFAIGTLLPIVLVGHALLPAQLTILATALLPLSIGVAIARTEFLGIPSLMHRRTLQVTIWILLAIGGAACGVLAVIGPQRWGWPLPATMAMLAGLCTLGGAIFWPRLRAGVGRFVLKDEYDTVEVLDQLSADLAADSQAIGPYVVARLSRVLNLRFALLLTKDDQWSHSHPRDPIPLILEDAVRRRARVLFAASSVGIAIESVLGTSILVLSLGKQTEALAVLCLGPKRADERFTRQDQRLLHAFGPQLALLLGKEPAAAQGEPQAPLALPDADDHGADRHAGALTRFEVRVLTLVAQGLTNKEISEQLGRNTRTVEKHLTNAYRRLDAQSRMDAVAIARRLALLSPAHKQEDGCDEASGLTVPPKI
ncbi:MAG: helix-turn-helix transcriptional regulator [Chloroflexota bacterium]